MESIVAEPKLHFYEYLQIDLLQQYVRSGILYLINTLVNSSEKWVSMRYYSSELTTLIDFAKDYYMLKFHNSTFAEHFYSLERQNLNGKQISPLNNALMWTVLPYILQKLEQFFIKLKGEEEEGRQLNLGLKLFVRLYPYIYAIVSIVNSCLKFRYLLEEKSISYDLIYWITKVKTGYKTVREQESKWPIGALFKSPGLLALMLAHKVLSWYYSSQRKKKNLEDAALQGKHVLPPSEHFRKQRKEKGKYEGSKGMCPICGSKINNPAFLRCSGYTFCYSCIIEYVEGYHKCPMTKLDCTADSIQIIYS